MGDFGKTAAQADRRIAAMKTAFPEALVTGYIALIPSMTNHPKDRHVLAATVAAGAPVIVTSNLRDFPRQALEPLAISAQSPDLFLFHPIRPCARHTVRGFDTASTRLTLPTEKRRGPSHRVDTVRANHCCASAAATPKSLTPHRLLSGNALSSQCTIGHDRALTLEPPMSSSGERA